MSSDQSGEPPLLQEEEAESGPRTGGKDEAPPATEGGSGSMVSAACCGWRDKLVLGEELFASCAVFIRYRHFNSTVKPTSFSFALTLRLVE